MENVSIELRKTMAANIERQLKKANKTQRDMCIDLGFKENTVSDWMNAKTYPRIDKIELMSNYFMCMKSDLIERYPFHSTNSLTEQEQNLLEDFRQLTPDGKGVAADAVKSYTFNPKYNLKAQATNAPQPETEEALPPEASAQSSA